MGNLPNSVSESFRRLNPHIYGTIASTSPKFVPREAIAAASRRIRQSGAAPNKLESAFVDYISGRAGEGAVVRPHALTFKLANGVKYTPDVCIFYESGHIQAYEVKGPWMTDDSVVKLKVAAHEYPWVRFLLAWKVSGQWQVQPVYE